MPTKSFPNPLDESSDEEHIPGADDSTDDEDDDDYMAQYGCHPGEDSTIDNNHHNHPVQRDDEDMASDANGTDISMVNEVDEAGEEGGVDKSYGVHRMDQGMCPFGSLSLVSSIKSYG